MKFDPKSLRFTKFHKRRNDWKGLKYSEKRKIAKSKNEITEPKNFVFGKFI